MDSANSLAQQIEAALSVLIGMPIWDASRALNLIMLDIGDPIEVQNRRGETVQIGTYKLHIQCSWRIVGKEGMVVGSHDIYEPSSGCTVGSEFDSDAQPTLYDERMDAWLDKHRRRPCQIKSVDADEVGGFSMKLTGGYKLDVIPVSSGPKDEHWRMLGPGADSPPHFVVEGQRAERLD
jgi:hypothetical protein